MPLSVANLTGQKDILHGSLDRRGSKVRFTAHVATDEDDTDTSPRDGNTPKLLIHKLSDREGRRGSTTSSKSDNGSVGVFKPRRRVSARFESLDYNVIESQRFLQEQARVKPSVIQRTAVVRWLINFLIGAYVAIIAVIVATCITHLSRLKFSLIYMLLKDCDTAGCLVGPTCLWVTINGTFVLLGSYLVTYHAPHAAGSGIPQIKCYLNGIRLPGLMNIRTLLVKAGGVILSVVGGLACGKEGPMIHSGAICASGLSRAEFYCAGRKWAPKFCDQLRSDEERRDFVAAGAASGVSAAFASPVGGVLFSLEEGASFLNQALTWRMLFSSVTASLLLDLIFSALKGHAGNMSSPGLVSFGYVGDISFKTFEIPIFMLMALVGGLSGALFVQINYKITLLRRRFITRRWMNVTEAVVVASLSAVVFVVFIFAIPDCQPIRGVVDVNATTANVSGSTTSNGHPGDRTHGMPGTAHATRPHVDDPYVIRGFCADGHHSRMANILFMTPEESLHAIIHAPTDEWSFLPLVALAVGYHLLATVTYGLMVSSGVFIPALLIGAVWGRLVGMMMTRILPPVGTNVVKYVLVGAACQLGGTVRMTISLAVIILECTGDITFSIPIILGLFISKWIGDLFTPGLYDLHIEILGIPLLPWEPPTMSYLVKASEVMSTPVVCLRSQEKIERIMKILCDDRLSHNGFPVVEDYVPDNLKSVQKTTFGRLKGFILKSQLESILVGQTNNVSINDLTSVLDLRMHMDRSPYIIQEDVSLPKIFRLFRGIGLRHLVVVNDRNRVVGMITRINLAKYRSEQVKGQFKLAELRIEDV